MARWQADGAARLAQAALELYAERGFEETTVAEVAARAGLTERTFYRHFADKREVLFAGTPILEDAIAQAVRDAPADASPLDAVARGLDASAAFFEGRRAFAQLRQGVIDANPELREREVAKLARLGLAIAEALRARGVTEPSATLAAQLGITVLHVAFQSWVASADGELAALLRSTLAQLQGVAAGATRAA